MANMASCQVFAGGLALHVCVRVCVLLCSCQFDCLNCEGKKHSCQHHMVKTSEVGSFSTEISGSESQS